MELSHSYSERLLRARKRILEMKNFYNHIALYLKFNIPLLLFKAYIFYNYIDNLNLDIEFIRWIEWNIYSISIIWLVIVAFHGLYIFILKYIDWTIFKPPFLIEWEQKQIDGILNEQNN